MWSFQEDDARLGDFDERDQQEVQQAGAQNQRTRETFDRAHRTCMEGKGYKVG